MTLNLLQLSTTEFRYSFRNLGQRDRQRIHRWTEGPKIKSRTNQVKRSGYLPTDRDARGHTVQVAVLDSYVAVVSSQYSS